MNENDIIEKFGFEKSTIMTLGCFVALWNKFEADLCSTHFNFDRFKEDVFSKKQEVDKHKKEIDNLYKKCEKINCELNVKNIYSFYRVRSSDISECEFKELTKRLGTYEKFVIMILIVWRVRCNMIHGLKRRKNLNSQKKLFTICNEILDFSIEYKL